MYRRTILKRIKDSLNNYPVVILTGPKQVGKSTEVYQFVKK